MTTAKPGAQDCLHMGRVYIQSKLDVEWCSDCGALWVDEGPWRNPGLPGPAPAPDVAGWLRAKAAAMRQIMDSGDTAARYIWSEAACTALADAWLREHPAGAGTCPDCAAVDALLARRTALDGLPDRLAKIQKAINVAKMNDPNDAAGRASDGPDQPLSVGARGAENLVASSTPPHSAQTRMPPDEILNMAIDAQELAHRPMLHRPGGKACYVCGEEVTSGDYCASCDSFRGEPGGKPVFIVRREPGPQLTGVDDNMPEGAIHFVPDPHAACVPREKVERLVASLRELMTERNHGMTHCNMANQIDAAIRECGL